MPAPIEQNEKALPSAKLKKQSLLSPEMIEVLAALIGIGCVVVIWVSPGAYSPITKILASAGIAALSIGMVGVLRRHLKIRSIIVKSVTTLYHHHDLTPQEVMSIFDDQIHRLFIMDRDHHLTRLMKDYSPNLQPILDELKDYDVNFSHQGFILVAFDACRLQHLNPPRHFRKRDTMMRDIMEASLPPNTNAYVLDLEDLYVCIFNVPYSTDPEETKNLKKRLEEYAKYVIERMDADFQLCTLASISELHSGVQSLTAAYQEVQGLFEYRNITGNATQIIQYTDYYVSFDSWYDFGNTYHKFEEVRRFIASIQVQDFATAKLLINELIANDYSRLYPSLLLARCRLFGLIDAAINAMGLLKKELDVEFLRELDPTTRIVNCSSYSDLLEQLNTIFDSIIDYYAGKKKDKPPEWFETIQRYIDTHYNDVNINVATIADQFNISSAYFARVFKKYMRISPLDYIHKLRMKSAKKLLSKGVSVKDTASIVGYGNPITMSRAFKRYEGVTPGTFLKH